MRQTSHILSAREARDRLVVRLDAPLPSMVSVGAGTALFVCGTCFCRDAEIESLAFVVDDTEQPVASHGMPRLDLFEEMHPAVDPFATAGMSLDTDSPDDPLLLSYRSGFWGVARIAPSDSRSCELLLRARLEGGRDAVAPLAQIALRRLPEPASVAAPSPGDRPLVAICMATHEPPMDLFRRQLDSIRAQTHRNWICLVSDDRSSQRTFAAMRRELDEDPRFVLSRSPRRLGFYLNFERALAMAPRDADYVALSDQDDTWYPEKLSTLIQSIGRAELVYSDSRVIDRRGELISETYWSRRHNNHSDVLSLLISNSVTGAASLFRRELLEYALPFPPAQFAHYHDHWIGLTALARGEIAFVPRPLYDYVQHGDAALGHEAANRPLLGRASVGQHPRERLRLWRQRYFADVWRLKVCATILQMRLGEQITTAKRDALGRFLDADSSLSSLARLWLRGTREFKGQPETLGAEWMLAAALTWRRLVSLTVRQRPRRGLRLEALPPPVLVPPPAEDVVINPEVRAIAEKIAPLELAVSDTAPRRVNLLIPSVDLEHFFGGYIGKFNLARRLAERGLRVRIVTVDLAEALPAGWQQTIEAFDGLAGVFDTLEVAFGREAEQLEVCPSDAFVATTWWTAHIAHSALDSLGRDRFLYLIQEYEPFTFPMGTYAALASQSYEFPHNALFSTELLRGYFAHHGIGVYAHGEKQGDARSATFENAITAIEPPSAAELRRRDTRRLLFYARPEAHATRNMFELGVLALKRALADGAFGDRWELHGIGSVEGARTLALGGGVELALIPRADQASYAKLLREHDLGVALMYTPHPSLVPLEMASAGMLTVTNSFENKTQAAMNAISSNLLAPPPTIEGISDALAAAAEGIDDFERRARGSAVHWSRDWYQSFGDELLDRVTRLLEV